MKGKGQTNSGSFKKGHIPWIKGKKHTKETRKKISKICRGRKPPKTAFKKGNSPWIKGKKHTKETKRKISNSLKGREIPQETRKKLKQARAKQILPVKDTKIEVKIQKFLKLLGIEFFTHQYINKIKHSYQCDIFIPSKNMIIECDGIYWHSYPQGKDIDHIRTKELIEKGFKVLRLWEHEINEMNIENFKEKLEDKTKCQED